MAKRTRPDAAAYGLPSHVTCPFCDDDQTELYSAFGPQLSVATYWCRTCYSPFEWIKWDGPAGHTESGGSSAQ